MEKVMSANKKKQILELEEILSLLDRIDEIASIERDYGFATRLLLLNLIIALDNAKVLDGNIFLRALKSQTEVINSANYKLATESLIDDLISALSLKRKTKDDKDDSERMLH